MIRNLLLGMDAQPDERAVTAVMLSQKPREGDLPTKEIARRLCSSYVQADHCTCLLLCRLDKSVHLRISRALITASISVLLSTTSWLLPT
jgi:hypothetical protein